jgi:hypothetical protein
VAIVLKAMAFGPPGTQRQHRVKPIEPLNGGLLVDTEDRGVLWRIDIEPDHVGSLAFEVRVIAGHIALEPVRLKPGALPDPRHHHVVDPQGAGQLAAAPVAGAISGPPPGPSQDAGFQPRRAGLGWAAAMAGEQASQPLLLKAALPAGDVGRTATHSPLDDGP